jgi:predicted ATPase with chaperone activity
MIHSVAGALEGGRLPALVGGGLRARPGEVSLAHNGVLFLDELPEFARPTLEALRQPIVSRRVSIARANHHVTYPARFQFVAAINPPAAAISTMRPWPALARPNAPSTTSPRSRAPSSTASTCMWRCRRSTRPT